MCLWPDPCKAGPAAPEARGFLPIVARENVYLGGIRQGVGGLQPPLGFAAPHPASSDHLPAVVRLAQMLGHALYLDSGIENMRYLIKWCVNCISRLCSMFPFGNRAPPSG